MYYFSPVTFTTRLILIYIINKQINLSHRIDQNYMYFIWKNHARIPLYCIIYIGHYNYKAMSLTGTKVDLLNLSLVAIEVDSLLVIKEYIFAQKSSRYATWLYVSYQRQPFKMAYFPRNQHPEVDIYCIQ